PTNGSRKLRPTWVPHVPAYRWPTTGLGLPAAGFLGAPGEFLIAPRTRADAGTDERDGARQGMTPEQRVGHRIQHHRRPIVPISQFSSTRIRGFSRINWLRRSDSPALLELDPAVDQLVVRRALEHRAQEGG